MSATFFFVQVVEGGGEEKVCQKKKNEKKGKKKEKGIKEKRYVAEMNRSLVIQQSFAVSSRECGRTSRHIRAARA